jgi:hypothetical protein
LGSTPISLGVHHSSSLERLGNVRFYTLEQAIAFYLSLLYPTPKPQHPINRKKSDRNHLLKARYADGETISELARAFGLSPQRVDQIIRGKRK